MNLDIEFVRSQFDQLSDAPDFVFAANAGGSYLANPVNQLINDYNQHTRVQPYAGYDSSAAAGRAMDRAKATWSQALNIDPSELTFGPSTSMNTYVMAQAIGATLNPGDEIVVTDQDHEANNGVWRRMADEKGITVREWLVDSQTGLLDPFDLDGLLNDNTRWVFFSHCSNIVGTTNPVEPLATKIKRASPARVFVDAVAHAPHHICDLKQLGVDGYVFSLYKVFGPHQSLMYVSADLHDELAPQCHFFNVPFGGKKMFDACGPQHCQFAACAGVIDYFQALHKHHFGDQQSLLPQQMQNIHGMIQQHENALAEPILDYLANHDDVRLIGKSTVGDNDRAPTIAFIPKNESSSNFASKLQVDGIGAESGHFYAYRLMKALGLDPEDGVVRISLVHYTSLTEVEKILNALDRAINSP